MSGRGNRKSKGVRVSVSRRWLSNSGRTGYLKLELHQAKPHHWDTAIRQLGIGSSRTATRHDDHIRVEETDRALIGDLGKLSRDLVTEVYTAFREAQKATAKVVPRQNRPNRVWHTAATT